MIANDIMITCGCFLWVVLFFWTALIRPHIILKHGCKCGGKWIRDLSITEAEMDDSHYYCDKCNKKISLPCGS